MCVCVCGGGGGRLPPFPCIFVAGWPITMQFCTEIDHQVVDVILLKFIIFVEKRSTLKGCSLVVCG